MKAYVYLYVYIHTSYTTYLHIIFKEYIYKGCVSVFFTNFWKLKSKEHNFYFLVEGRLLWFLSDIESITMWHCRNTPPIKQNFIFYYGLLGTHILTSLKVRKELCGIIFSTSSFGYIIEIQVRSSSSTANTLHREPSGYSHLSL